MKIKIGIFSSLVIYLLLTIVTTSPVQGNIAGSAHDFSALGWSNGEICLPCHTPHNANAAIQDAPLWNHGVTTATFTIYTSPTMQTSGEQPRGPSKLCLSCHDGTVALDSFGGATGANMISGDADLGTSLDNDHPISIYWSHQNNVSTICVRCHNPRPTDFNPILPMFDRYIECSTCHDVHNKTNIANLLRMTMVKSALCFQCHGK